MRGSRDGPESLRGVGRDIVYPETPWSEIVAGCLMLNQSVD